MNNIEKVQIEIGNLLNDTSIRGDKLIVRLTILEAYLKKENIDMLNKQLLLKYQEVFRRFSSNESGITLGTDINDNIKILSMYIFNSDFSKSLRENNIFVRSIDQLKLNAYKYSGDRLYMTNLTDALNLYQILVTIKKNEEDKHKLIKRQMQKIIKGNLLNEYNEYNSYIGSGSFRNVYKRVLKTRREYNDSRRLVFNKLMALYLKDKLIDIVTFQYSFKMISELFDFYSDNMSISLNDIYSKMKIKRKS